jgi:hypothetical protein
MLEQLNKKVTLEPESSIFSKSSNLSLRCPQYVGKKIFMEKRNKFLQDNKNYLIKADGPHELADGTFCEIIRMKPTYPFPKRPDGTYGCDL